MLQQFTIYIFYISTNEICYFHFPIQLIYNFRFGIYNWSSNHTFISGFIHQAAFLIYDRTTANLYRKMDRWSTAFIFIGQHRCAGHGGLVGGCAGQLRAGIRYAPQCAVWPGGHRRGVLPVFAGMLSFCRQAVAAPAESHQHRQPVVLLPDVRAGHLAVSAINYLWRSLLLTGDRGGNGGGVGGMERMEEVGFSIYDLRFTISELGFGIYRRLRPTARRDCELYEP